ncbi:filamentous hemagglutinin N-terminal domain-containing protein [Orbaceae bacterium ac157xtp]
MNKHFYRIVFNKARGLLMVVSEIVKTHQSQGRTLAKATSKKALFATLTPITLLTYLALGLASISVPAYANTIIVDKNANKNQQPIVLPTANGATQINIQTPSKGGVSHNKYTQFDVSQKGVILNNSAKTSKTDLAGYINGNGYLQQSGGAKIILNEVNSKHASQLNGYIEVAGQKAQVVIANAAGITCNGCGFINANRATLTTGNPILENGQLKGYLVEQGQINVNGKGLDSSKQDYTDLIARSVVINAGLWANDATVITGKNEVSQDLTSIKALENSDDTNPKPEFSLDVAALGGMYAGKIKLVGTEKGVGVHNAGQLGASAGSLTITADGKIVNSGRINSKKDIVIVNKHDVINDGNLVVKDGTITLNSSKSINNTGKIVSKNKIKITSNTLSNDGGIASDLDTLQIEANKKLENNGQIISAKSTTLKTNGEFNNNGNVYSTSENINLLADSIINNGKIISKQQLNIETDKKLTNTKVIGSIASNANLKASAINNSGEIVTDKQLNINATNNVINKNLIQSNNDKVTILATQYIENKGSIIANDELSLNSKTAKLNNTGVITSNKSDLIVKAKSGIHNEGTLLADQNISLLTDGRIHNTDTLGAVNGSSSLIAKQKINNVGKIIADSDVFIESGAELESKGIISSNHGELKIVAKDDVIFNIDNIIYAQNDIAIRTDNGIEQNGKMISHHGAMSLLGKNNITLNGEMNSSKDLTIKTDGDISNAENIQSLNGHLILGANHINNYSQMIAKNNVMIQALGGINNTGTIGSVTGNIDLSATSHIALSNSSIVKAKNNIKLNSGQAITQQGLIGSQNGSVDLKAQKTISVENNINAKDSIVITAQENIENSANIITTNGNVKIVSQQNIKNMGTIYGGNNLTITADKLTNNSNLISGKDASFNISDFNNHSVIGAGITQENKWNSSGNLAIQAINHYQNEGKIFVKDKLKIEANDIELLDSDIQTGSVNLVANQGITFTNTNILVDQKTKIKSKYNAINIKNAKLVADNMLVSSSTFSNDNQSEISANNLELKTDENILNYGLINGDHVKIESNVLNNNATGRIYGTDLIINSREINNKAENGTAAVIASRNTLKIASQKINNYGGSLISSEGSMIIGGNINSQNQINGNVAEINNHSSSIESGADLSINVDDLNNINDHIETEVQEVSNEHIIEYQVGSSPDRYKPSDIRLEKHEVLHIYVNGGRGIDNFNKYEYDRVTLQTVVTETDPAKIQAGNNLTINANNILNDNSQLLSGNQLAINAINMQNISIIGEQYIKEEGIVTNFYRINKKGSDDQGRRVKTYKPAEKIETIDLNSAPVSGDLNVVKNNVNISNITSANINSPTTNSDLVTTIENNVSLNNSNQVDSDELKINKTTSTVATIDKSDIDLPVLNSLYQPNPDSNANYLIETDPKFTNLKDWLSSDYMIGQLKQDPNNVQKRLGDGYYEQKIIREQLVALTGSSKLNGYSNDEDQYKALMTAGIEFANQYNLKLGVALTAEQMSTLTSDIVWLVEKTVTLPNGVQSHVLVPQVYIVGKVNLNTGGSLISGKNTTLQLVNDLSNGGKISALEQMNIFAGTINNEKGSTLFGDQIDIKADKDINNLGGKIIANKQIKLMANRDINLVSTTTNNASGLDNDKFSHTNIDSESQLITTDKSAKIQLSANNDINLNAATIVADGQKSSITINAGNNLNLSTVQTNNNQYIEFDSDNYSDLKQTQDVGSTLVSKGNIVLNSGNDTSIIASQISSGEGLYISTENDLKIEEGRKNVDYTYHSKTKGKSGFASITTTTHEEHKENSIIGSHLDANNIELKAKNNLSVVGSQVVSDKDMSISANNIQINAAEESYLDFTQKTEKKSGLMSGGGLGVTIGKMKEDLKQTDTEKGYVGSVVGSTEGNVTIQTGKDLNIAGSDIIAKQDIKLTGENVKIESNDAQVNYKEEYTYEKSGLTLAITGTPATMYDTAQAIKHAKEKGNDKLLALQSIKGALTVIEAIQDL